MNGVTCATEVGTLEMSRYSASFADFQGLGLQKDTYRLKGVTQVAW